jgi:hypothetical protein
MELTVNASIIIDSLIELLGDWEEQYKKIPRGTYIWPASEYRSIWETSNMADQKFMFASDLLNMPPHALWKAATIARRWYVKTGWKKCLPEHDAERILAFLARK